VRSEACPSTFDFDLLADSYDRWYETVEGTVYDKLEKQAVARFLPRNVYGKNLLDVGCGTGHWSRFFSDRGFKVMGIDLSPMMVDVARSKRTDGASFEVADAHALPFEDGRFDVAVAITTLEFVRDPALVVQEMVRCTRRPGGLVIVGALNSLSGINRRRKATGKEPYAVARFFAPRQLRNLLVPCGRTRVETVAFVPRQRPLMWLGLLWDTPARLLQLPTGAFIVGRAAL
jgi:ubiquinone/menaquinone biosynthesis C-methylase UbiE